MAANCRERIRTEMRHLTIKRTGSFVGCMGKVSVFITDPAGDKTVCGDACRLLGLLGNGKTEIYEISEQSAKLYLVAGTQIYNDSTVIPEGTDDVYLEGRNRYDPMHGNAFILSSNDSGEKTADRKKRNTKALLLLFVVPLIVGLAVGLIPHFIRNSPGNPKRFVCDGMSIELTDKFVERENVSSTAYYTSKDVIAAVIEDRFDEYPWLLEYTVDDYLKTVWEINGIEAESVKKETDGSLVWYDRVTADESTKTSIRNRTYVFRSDEAFWLVQFLTKSSAGNKFDGRIEKYASSVSFSKAG